MSYMEGQLNFCCIMLKQKYRSTVAVNLRAARFRTSAATRYSKLSSIICMWCGVLNIPRWQLSGWQLSWV